MDMDLSGLLEDTHVMRRRMVNLYDIDFRCQEIAVSIGGPWNRIDGYYVVPGR